MKFELIDEADAPENLSAMAPEARAKLDMLRALPAGKAAKVAVPKAEQRGFKASITRLATTHRLNVEVWSEGEHCYIRRTPAATDQSEAGS